MADDAHLAPLPFGIPQLDDLLGYEEFAGGAFADALKTETSLAIVGQDGTGKSVFALHLASAYHALHHLATRESKEQNAPLVFYVSSDFRYGAAHRVWQNFALNYPWQRHAPFAGLKEIAFRRRALSEPDSFLHVKLMHCFPSASAPNDSDATWVTDYVERHTRYPRERSQASVAFIDLASTTTGDDWLFLARLLASVPKQAGSPPNLLIVDSVAGFETLVGNRNSFGENMTRRAKIAQLVRVASPNWHTVFLVEEPERGTHHPEEYVTDTVIHLVRQGKSDRIRRVLEIEKCRARSFGRGEHPFEIRDGLGSSTGGWENPDDPMTLVHEKSIGHMKRAQKYHAYVQVFPSLHYLSGNFSKGSHLTRPSPEADGEIPFAVPFGVPYLDSSLARGKDDHGRGLPPGKVTSLIGDEGTLKASLAEQFLLEGFRYFPQIFDHVFRAVGTWMLTPSRDLWEVVREQRFSFRATYGAVVPRFVCDRVEQSPGEWLTDEYFQAQRRAVLDLSRTPRLRLLTRLELEQHAEQERRPLTARRDVNLFYTSNEYGLHLFRQGLWSAERTAFYRQFVLTLSVLRASSGFLTPVVFLSTHDSSTERLADRILDLQWADLSKSLASLLAGDSSQQLVETCQHGLIRVLERFLIVRRLELVDASSQQLWQITKECVTHALHLVGNLPTLDVAPPKNFPGEVRVVISDLRLLRDTYPEVGADPLFLPTIVFRLRRLGVTTLLVDSDRGRPDQDATQAMNAALRSLVDHQIYTWKVPFFGEQRVAISVLPPIMPEQASAIRELKLVHRSTSAGRQVKGVDVDPHFELYSGLEFGNPSAVPLEVIFYGETAAFDQYVAEERSVFARLFSPVETGRSIIDVRKAADYHSLRDYCHLPADTKLPQTLVFMIDGYWALTRSGALRSQAEYLGDRLDARFGDGRKDYMDVFGLFGPTRRHILDQKESGEGGVQPAAAGLSQPPLDTRADFFTNAPYSAHAQGEVNRVPFMWDFGFLLCNEEQWLHSLDVPFPTRPNTTVGTVWNELTRVQVARTKMGLEVTQRSNPNQQAEGGEFHGACWRDFFEACKVVATTEHARTGRDIAAFDFFTGGVDSLIALFMEVWFSEIHGDATRVRRVVAQHGAKAASAEVTAALRAALTWADNALTDLEGFSAVRAPEELLYLQDLLCGRRGAGSPRAEETLGVLSETYRRLADDFRKSPAEVVGQGHNDTDIRWACLQSRITGYSLQWYKAWLLLLEVLDLRQYFRPEGPFEFKPRDPTFDAVASRHWYRTACEAAQRSTANGEHVTRVPVRLPGHFAVRSGWYLAVARASRSYRLADRALDILSSRRANRSRLHRGLGLPTRDIPGFDEHDDSAGPADRVLTGLTVARLDGVHRVSYHDLLQLGGSARRSHGPLPHFRWLLRSRFRDYDRQARVVRRWMNRVFGWSVQYRYQARSTWRSSFIGYDEMQRGDFSKVIQYPSFFQYMPEFLDGFIDELNVAIDSSPKESRI
jgi:KaiC/GvpD/RAD55 family RecA-like ATPase